MTKMVIRAYAVIAAVIGFTTAAQAEEINDWLSAAGDIRNRFEYIDQDGRDVRERFRLRARLAFDAVASEEVDLHFRLASGGDDPVSSNQTLDEGFSSKDIRLDRAYVDWHPIAFEGVNLYAGKMANPWVTVKNLLWDSDLNPEGFSLNLTQEGDALDLMLQGGAFMLEERAADGDTYLFSVQAAAKLKPSEETFLLGGASLFAFDNMKGFPVVFDSEDSFGNSAVAVLDADGNATGELLYADEYTEFECFGVAGLDAGAPIRVYSDIVVNTEADDEDFGYMVGGTLGKAKDPGSWQLDYNYRNLEANAVVGAFTDSDSGGGGTDVSGHRIEGKYQLSKHWQFTVTYFINEIEDGNTDYQCGQVDLIAKF